MPRPLLICPAPATATAGGAKPRTRELPHDLLQEASQRLAIISFLGTILWLLGTVFYHLAIRQLAPGDSTWMRPLASDIISGVSALISGRLLLRAKDGQRSPIRAGSRARVPGSHVIGARPGDSLGSVPDGRPGHAHDHLIGAVVLMFAAILPNSPGRCSSPD
jgi:hypothetical protein